MYAWVDDTVPVQQYAPDAEQCCEAVADRGWL